MLLNVKARFIFLFVIINYVVTGVSLIFSTNFFKEWIGIFFGIALFVIGTILYFAGKKKRPILHVICICINSVATGFSMGTYFYFKNINDSFVSVLLFIFPFLLTLWGIFVLYTNKELSKKIKIFLVCGLLCILLVCSFIAIHKISLALFFLYLFLLICYTLLILFTYTKNRSILSDLCITSSGIYSIVTLVVIIVLSEGDALEIIGDVFEGFFDRKGTKKK